MLPFQRLLKAVNPDRTTLTRGQLQQVVSQCEVADIADIVGWMEHLAAEKAKLPASDGDASDDISNAQFLMAQMLLGLAERFEREVEKALAGAGEDTRRWMDVARQMRKKS